MMADEASTVNMQAATRRRPYLCPHDDGLPLTPELAWPVAFDAQGAEARWKRKLCSREPG